MSRSKRCVPYGPFNPAQDFFFAFGTGGDAFCFSVSFMLSSGKEGKRHEMGGARGRKTLSALPHSPLSLSFSFLFSSHLQVSLMNGG